MSSHAALGQVALDKRDYDEAIKQYTKALLTNTSNPSPLWLIQRSTAYQRFGKHELALADAECAIHAALDRGRRELIATAQFRRAIALNCLQRYGDSRICFTWCRKLNEKEKGLGMWQGKVAKDYEKAEQSVGKDAKETKITVKEIPGRIDFAKSEASRAEAESSKSSNSSAEVTTTSSEKISAGGEANEKGKRKVIVKANSKNENAAIMPMESGRTSLDKIRHDWYQSTEKVTIDLLVKGVPPQPVTEVLIRKDSVKVSYPTTDDKENNLWLEVSFEDLDGEVDPESSTFKIMKTKIEITLKKSVPGIKWKRLGNFMKDHVTKISGQITEASSEESSVSTKADYQTTENIVAPTPLQAPSYPTSSRNGPKDWDKLASLADEDDGEKDVNSFFQTLYSGSDPDTQKAMMKSYIESNGTSLSTNWKDVSQGPVATHPPEGVDVKKWGA